MESTGASPSRPGTPATPAEVPAASPNTEADSLEKVLPQIRELAQKVGGYGKLADLARQLEQGGE